MALSPGLGQFSLATFTDFTCGSDLRLQVATQNNVSASTSHIGGNSNDPWPARLSNNFSFLFVVLGIQHLVLDFGLTETRG